MEFLIGIATSIAAKAAEYTVKPVCRQLGYLFFYSSNVDSLRIQIQELGYARDRLQHRVDEARRNGEEIEADVENWLNEVDRIKEESESFLQNEDHAKTRCSSKGPFLNLVSRHQLSRKAKKKVQVVISEINKSDKFDGVSYHPGIQNSVANKGYEVFESRDQTLREITEALKDSNVRMIGMYGMGGVGKTMLAKEVVRIAKEENLFDKVAFTTVSQTPDVEKIQQDIAEQVGLEKFHEIKSRIVRAERLRHRLIQEKKILVILDDIWNELDLSAVGIHFDDHQKCCKILLTSRFLYVLQDHMGAERNVEIKVLSNIEAMNLFKKNAGVSSESVVQPLVEDIVKECAGLPIAITTVAHALKNKSLSIWKDALLQLKRSIRTNIEGMDQKVYASIKLSYNFLESDEEAKSLLLLCSLHEEDANIKIKDLMIYGVGLGLFQGVYALEEARDRVDSLVNKLKGRCLLLDGYDDGAVKMHDVIRDVMISIALEDRQMYNIPSVDKFEDFLKKKRLVDSAAISLCVRRHTNKLPERLECPRLKLLLMLSRGEVYLEIPEQYFEEKKELKVLCLDKVNVELLPASFCLLQNLEALCLYGCMGSITVIGELKHLKILDLSRSTIEELPKHIGQLYHLQLLNLEDCEYLKVIQPGLISSLIRLEELNMRGVTIKWEDKGVNGESINASLIELKNLPQLTTLYLSIQNANILPKGFFSENMKRYELFIGEVETILYGVRSEFLNLNSLHLKLSRRNLLGESGLEMMMKRSEVLCLYGFEGLNNVVYELDPEGFHQLKSFEFHDNDEIRYVVNSSNIQPCSAFLNLERLCLFKLMNLEQIYYGKLTKESFGNLRSITVRKCDRLKNLFSSSIAGQFEKIEVIECKTVKEIFAQGTDNETSNATDKIVCPKLRILALEDLPEYIQFFQSDLETADTSSSDSPFPLFSKKVAFPGLKKLTLTSMKFNVLYSDQLPTTFHSLQNLTRLTVNNCHGLKHLLPFSMARSLVHLEMLIIRGCRIMEEVLIAEEQVEGRLEKISFPKLQHLLLWDLPKLEKFCIGNSIEFPTLSILRIMRCPRLSTFIIDSTSKEMKSTANQSLFSEKVMFPNLEYLTMDGREVMNEVWHRRSSAVPFFTLKGLILSYEDEKSVVFSFKFIQRFQNLEILSLRGNSVEQICQQEESDASEESDWPLPRLRVLELWNLHNLRHLLENIENVKPGMAFQTIEAIDVDNCPRLTRLLPFLEAFTNLKDLRVSSCHKMINLLASSTAKSLVQLTRMSVEGCKALREVITSKEGETEDEIVFSRLRILALHDLPNLESFYSGNATMRFPLLDKLILSQCPSMWIFSRGNIISQKLNQIIKGIVNVDIWTRRRIEWHMDSIEYDCTPGKQIWEGDINSTVRKIWEDDPIITLQEFFNEV